MLSTYLTCQRQFQLRYVNRLAWPDSYIDEQIEGARNLGDRYHQMIHRALLGFQMEPMPDDDPKLGLWLSRFLTWSESLPSGQRLVEFNLTVPIASHYLSGRLDLLIVSEDEAHIFDWKTTVHPPDRASLWQEMQTRLYLALVSEGGGAIGKAFDPANISLTYWYPLEPPLQVRLEYDQEKHKENWAILNDVAAGIDWLMNQDSSWPKTANLDSCRRCPYQILCGRQVSSIDLTDWEQTEDGVNNEPDCP
jgi:CRISPR/Cas system-associated exonuclease Cas4 (RecB family)